MRSAARCSAAAWDIPRARYTSTSSFSSISRCGAARKVACVGREASKSSRWERIETNSPAPIDSAPASRPAIPVNITIDGATPVAPIPNTSAKLDTKPSLAPNTAARKLPESRIRPSVASPRTTSSCTNSSAAILSGTSESFAYGLLPSARWTNAKTKIEPKCVAKKRRSDRWTEGRDGLACSPKSSRQ